MVTLRRGARLQRQCNLPEPPPKTAPKASRKRKQAGKENIESNIAADQTPKQTKTDPPSEKPKQTAGKKRANNEKDLPAEKEPPVSRVNSRRSKRSRLDCPSTLEEKVDSLPKVTPGGLIYEVGRKKSVDRAAVPEEEFVLKLNNSNTKKRKPLLPAKSAKQVKAVLPKSKQISVQSKKRKTGAPLKSKLKPTTPAKSKMVTPAKVKSTTLAKSKTATPAKAKSTTPAKAKSTTPAKVKSTTPAKPKKATPAKAKPTTPAKGKSTTPSKIKSPIRLRMKPEPRTDNEVFKLPRASCIRKQKVSFEMAQEVGSMEKSYSVCSMIMDKHRKKRKEDDEEETKKEDSSFLGKDPSFAGISPIAPLVGKREQDKLALLERSMNLFECPGMSPIIASDDKSSKLALKSDLKALPKRSRTKPVTPKKAPSTPKNQGKSKKPQRSLLKTPVRQVFQSKSNTSLDSSLFEEKSEEEEDGEKSGEEGGYSMYPLSREYCQPEPVNKTGNKSKTVPAKMDYNNWLEDHTADYDKFKDFELCIE